MIKVPLVKDAFMHENATRKALSLFIECGAQLTMGPWCERFEKKFAFWQGRQHAVLFNSGSSANLALFQALKNTKRLGASTPQTKVGVSSLTWSTNVMPILQMGWQPIAIDVAMWGLNVFSPQLEKHIDDLQAFFATNVLGFAGDLMAIRELCDKHNVLMLEDNCEALGTILTDGYTGNFGFASTFSFYVSHQLSTIEGGMVCTDDPCFADALRVVRAHGWDRDVSELQRNIYRDRWSRNDFQAKFSFYEMAYNLRPTEITGFLGCEQLAFLEDANAAREANFYKLAAVAATNPELLPVTTVNIEKLSSFAFPVLCCTPELRTRYLERFAAAGIETRPIIAGNIVRQPFWDKTAHPWCYELLGADFVDRCGFYCGNYPGVDLDTIAECLKP